MVGISMYLRKQKRKYNLTNKLENGFLLGFKTSSNMYIVFGQRHDSATICFVQFSLPNFILEIYREQETEISRS